MTCRTEQVLGSSLNRTSALAAALAVPLLAPLRWQSLLLPILPHKLLSFLEAPVPYIIGLPKPAAGETSRPVTALMAQLLR